MNSVSGPELWKNYYTMYCACSDKTGRDQWTFTSTCCMMLKCQKETLTRSDLQCCYSLITCIQLVHSFTLHSEPPQNTCRLREHNPITQYWTNFVSWLRYRELPHFVDHVMQTMLPLVRWCLHRQLPASDRVRVRFRLHVVDT